MMRHVIKPELRHYTGSFLLQTAMMVAMTLIPFFCFQHLGGKERSAALAYGLQTLSLGITCFLSAPVVSAWRNGLIGCLIGSVGFGVFYFLASFATSVAAFCILTAIAMSFFAFAWPALQSWLGAQPDERKRTRSFSNFNVAIGLGLTVGPLLEGALYQFHFQAAFLAVLLLSLAAATLLFTLPRESTYFCSHAPVACEIVSRSASPNSNANEIFLYCGWLTNMLGWGVTGAVRTVYAGYLKDILQRGTLVLFWADVPGQVFTAGQTPTAASLYSGMQTVLSLGYFAAVFAMGRTLRWQHRLSALLAFESVLALSIWKLADSRSLFLILLCHAAMGAFTAFGYLSSQCYSAANPALKHRRIAVNEGLAQFGGFLVPLASAQLGVWYGLSWPFRYSSLLIATFLILQLLSLRYAKWRSHSALLLTQKA